jgi:molybdopterin synthase sulfur carrier subunit
MVKVSSTSSFHAALESTDPVEIEASTVRQLLLALVQQYPRMQDHLDEGVAVAVEGEIYRDNWDKVIAPGTEVFLMPRIQGG